jgi:hypothetical protein
MQTPRSERGAADVLSVETGKSSYRTSERPNQDLIEVLELRPTPFGGALKAIARVRVGEVIVDNIKILHQPDALPFVGMPQVPTRRNADGSGSGWQTVVTIRSQSAWHQLRDRVLAAWRAQGEGR